MSVLICKNIEKEGPGTIEDYLNMQKIPHEVVELAKSESLPETREFDTLIMMGGPMSVNEDEKYPFIKEEEKLVRDFISKGKKILGVCLGAQIMAKALGARVYMGNKEEVGWLDIELTEEGLMDLHMKNLAFNSATSEDPFRKFKVFHWHEETFDMPKCAVRLASSELYRNQAFRYGDKAYAFQFHIEVNKKMIYDWFKDNSAETHKLKCETDKFYDVYRRRAVNFYDAFFN